MSWVSSGFVEDILSFELVDAAKNEISNAGSTSVRISTDGSSAVIRRIRLPSRFALGEALYLKLSSEEYQPTAAERQKVLDFICIVVPMKRPSIITNINKVKRELFGPKWNEMDRPQYSRKISKFSLDGFRQMSAVDFRILLREPEQRYGVRDLSKSVLDRQADELMGLFD